MEKETYVGSDGLEHCSFCNKPREKSLKGEGESVKQEVPIWCKSNFTLEEASAYSGIGINKLRKLMDERNCDFVLWNGSKRLIKRIKLDEYLARAYSI